MQTGVIIVHILSIRVIVVPPLWHIMTERRIGRNFIAAAVNAV